MAGGPSIEQDAADFEWARELLPRIPSSAQELDDMQWAVAKALQTARNDGGNTALQRLADELLNRIEPRG